MRIQDLFEEHQKLVVVNTHLNPLLWKDTGDQPKLDPAIASKLLKIAEAFYKSIEVPLDIVDCTLTGSNANYTWNAHSDLDLHLIVRGAPTEHERELYDAKKAVWGDIHDITIKGLPVEVYVQGESDPHYSTGVYSLFNNSWNVIPSKQKPHINDISVAAKKDAYINIIESALLDNNLDSLTKIKKKIAKMRKAGLERSGEWSTENLVFKALRNLGLIDQITDKIHSLEDEELSLETTQTLL